MEALLSVALDNLSSSSTDKIKKGLRQVDLLLAQICVPKQEPPKSSVADKRRSVIIESPTKTPTAEKRRSAFASSTASPAPSDSKPIYKPLSELRDDAAFREFFKLQDGFECNVAMRLIAVLERLLKKHDEANDVLMAGTLEMVQGVLLLHPPSRRLFSKEAHMNILLDLLDPEHPPRIQSNTIITLVTALLSSPTNTRLFESLEGLLTVTSLMNSPSTPQSVKIRVIEFLYFYLMPETPSIAGSRGSKPLDLINRSPSKLAAAFGGDGGGETKTTWEKQHLLRNYSSPETIDGLVRDLENNAPFEGMVS